MRHEGLGEQRQRHILNVAKGDGSRATLSARGYVDREQDCMMV